MQNKGIIESSYRAIEYAALLILSTLKKYLLILRGYDIDRSCTINLSSSFFQSAKGSLHISRGVTVGKHVQVKSGFRGVLSIGKKSCVYDYTTIDAQEQVTIGNDCLIAPYCYITDYDHSISNKKRPINTQGYTRAKVTIGNNVWLGAHTTVVKGVSIGDNSVIGANSVVTKNIPANVIAVGNPAKVIRKRV